MLAGTTTEGGGRPDLGGNGPACDVCNEVDGLGVGKSEGFDGLGLVAVDGTGFGDAVAPWVLSTAVGL